MLSRRGRIMDSAKKRRQLRRDEVTLEADPMFDAEFYRGQHMGNIASRLSPARHYLLLGRRNMHSPHPLFDMVWYVETNADVAAADLDPLLHYICFGRAEGRKPNPFFDPAWYLGQYPDVARAGIDPVQHFLQFGSAEGRDPSPIFQTRWYLQHNEDVAASGMNPLAHYLRFGRSEGRETNGFPVDFTAAQPAAAMATAQAEQETSAAGDVHGARSRRAPNPSQQGWSPFWRPPQPLLPGTNWTSKMPPAQSTSYTYRASPIRPATTIALSARLQPQRR